MGKKGGWLTAVKRAFRSPTKDTPKKTKSHEQQDQDKGDKRRWIFRKQANQEPVGTAAAQTKAAKASTGAEQVAVAVTDQKHAIATVEAARFNNNHARDDREQHSAVVIQTAFRGYLARRALRALKGLVKLQALVRGHNVRKQAKMTLRCMQALVRLQARVLDQRSRFSHEGSSSRKSTLSDTNNNNNNNNNSLWESRFLQDRKSMSREGSSIASDWDERPHTVEQVKAMLQRRKEAALKRDKSFSQQAWRNGGASSSSIGNEDEAVAERPKRLDRWMTMGRASTDQRDTVKNVEIDTTSHPYSSYIPTNYRRSHPNYQYNPVNPQLHQPQRHSIASPATPSPAKSRPIQVRSASPRIGREDRTTTPNLRFGNHHYRWNNGGANLPNYMAATESAKARSRSQSAPRQRASTPERDRVVGSTARKRLSYPDAHNVGAGNYYGHGLRSPSFRSVRELQYFGVEQHSNYSSCCTDSLGGEISPASTTDLRRWLR